ncbi:DHA2 family efflux MFS transporter permease subunit [Nonomuraea candida]|uniref:DHA2 family efflux MFS transporter permease subunit n=1 Tax=Nonomuraea candida TaxID=359159 RepID=UPI000693D383|nr:DHA2 family efflux MFS transporter permease subunit [Nonomuraea candida]
MKASRSASGRALGRSGAPAGRPWAALTLLSLLQFLIAVDVTVVNVALPSIGAEFGAGPTALAWVVNGYALVGGGLLLLGGRLADLLGRRRLFLIGAGVFGLASLAAGVAPDLGTLIAARFGQGVGEALASPAAMSLIALLFPGPAERARALGVWGAISGGGLVVGVLLSGVLTELLHWRWIFFVNLPVAVAVLVATPLLVRSAGPGSRGRLDAAGAVLLTSGPLALVYGILQAAHRPWTDPGVALPVAAGVSALALFVLVEARSREPLVPLAFFAERTRAVANAATVLLSAALSTTFFLCTLYLQNVLGLSPLRSGLAFLPFCGALLLAMTQVARLIRVLGMKYTAIAGLLCTAAGVGWLARLPVDGRLWIDVIPGMVAVAAGMAVGLVALQNAALHGVTEADAGVAAGVQRSVDQLGGAFGLAVLVGAAAAATTGPQGGLADQVAGYRAAFGYGLIGVLVAAIGVWAAARDDRRRP